MDGLAGETQLLTRNGALRIEDAVVGPRDLLTTSGSWLSCTSHSLGERDVQSIVLSRSGALKTVRATAGQLWWAVSRRGVIRPKSTAHLRPGDRLLTVFVSRPDALGLDRTAAARGFVFGDGSMTSARRSCANFCGDKDAALLELFAGMGRPPRTYGDVVRIGGLPGTWKSSIPDLCAPGSEIYGWLAGYFAADGDVDKTGRPTLSSANRAHLDFVRTACQSVGVGTFGVRTRWRLGYGDVPTPLHLVGLMRGDLDESFFLIPAHRARYAAGRSARERRGWNVMSCGSSAPARVFAVANEDGDPVSLFDNLLTGAERPP